MFHWLGFIIFGLIVGLIARAITPGRQDIGLLGTTLLGIAGSVVAGWLGRGLGWYGPQDGAGFIMSTAGAVLVIALYYFVTGRSSRASKTNFPRKAA